MQIKNGSGVSNLSNLQLIFHVRFNKVFVVSFPMHEVFHPDLTTAKESPTFFEGVTRICIHHSVLTSFFKIFMFLFFIIIDLIGEKTQSDIASSVFGFIFSKITQ